MSTTPKHSSSRPKQRLVIESPGDIVAAVPILLGFHPADSLVLLTCGGERDFTGRLDLPEPGEEDEAVESLMLPCLKYDVDRATLLAYTDGPRPPVLDMLADKLTLAGIGIVDLIVVSDGHYLSDHDAKDFDGPIRVPARLDQHRFTAQSVYAGQRIHASRADHAESMIAPAPDALDDFPDLVNQPGVDWIPEIIARGTPLEDDEVAVFVQAVRHPAASLQAVELTTRGTGQQQFWCHIARRVQTTPETAEALAIVAYAMWRCGDGALAWSVIDRIAALGIPCDMAEIVDGLLTIGATPDLHEELFAGLAAGSE